MQKQYSAGVAKWLAKQGGPDADRYREPDPIFEDLLPIWTAWHDLSASRPAGMTVNGIPWREMSAYCADHGIDGWQRLRWIRLLRELDTTYLIETGSASRKDKEEERADGEPRSRP